MLGAWQVDEHIVTTIGSCGRILNTQPRSTVVTVVNQNIELHVQNVPRQMQK